MRRLEDGRGRLRAGTALVIALACVPGCGSGPAVPAGPAEPAGSPHGRVPVRAEPKTPDVYAHDRPGMLSPAVRDFPPRVYVPNSESDTVSVIDPRTYRVIREFPVHGRPQHVVPSWDLKTLWVNNNDGNTLTPIDPKTGRPGRSIPVDDPYNLYFTPDGRTALVMAERNNRLDFRNPRTMRLRYSLPMPCRGVNHGDFTADETVFLASCEFSGQLVAVDVAARKVRAVVDLTQTKVPHGHPDTDGVRHATADGHTTSGGHATVGGHARVGHARPGGHVMPDGRAPVGHVASRGHGMAGVRGSMPQDVKLSPDGTTFYVADMSRNGVWLVGAKDFRVKRFVRTGEGAHGLYVSRDSKLLYVSNRGEGSVSVISFARHKPVATWRIPGGGSPDMGGLSADGRRLWLSGRYDGVVYVLDTADGRLIRKIPVGAGPHGLAVYPQPGRYSLGHTGIFR
ncbi:YVTN family beta-propeller repeat protein [Streptosporangium jomthongense]|uniref:YNCE-like beta-propeller domain-containing protein n=1 Tax=Streptosporangium jomthongense TaxID=1193683 RepID=A0ABV8EW08_9ACTN